MSFYWYICLYRFCLSFWFFGNSLVYSWSVICVWKKTERPPGFYHQRICFIISEFKHRVEADERRACDSCVQKLRCWTAASCSNSLSSSKMDEIKSIFVQPWFSLWFLMQRNSLLSQSVCCYNTGYLPLVLNVLLSCKGCGKHCIPRIWPSDYNTVVSSFTWN